MPNSNRAYNISLIARSIYIVRLSSLSDSLIARASLVPSGINTSRGFALFEICVTYPLEEVRDSGFPFLDHSSGLHC